MTKKYINLEGLRALLAASEETYHFIDSGDIRHQDMVLECVSDDPCINGAEIKIAKHFMPACTIPARPRFPDYDAAKAQAEGWAMFEAEGRYQLQRDDEANVFESDADAIIHVAVCAKAGSKLHLEALHMIGRLVQE